MIYRNAFAFTLMVVSVTGAAQAEPHRLEEISSLATGGRFYMDTATFHPAENGKLRYNMVGSGQGAGDRVSLNEIDCGTGQLRSPLQSWQAHDVVTRQSGNIPGPAHAITVTPRTRLHSLLKQACQQHQPNIHGDW
ncbi:hypothetical protein [Vampirovibrio sp.]|uniref:hypothetical protein n=1 Tax=Vampirovibrio sp. TaxID=2717857 RepID=UPI0035941F39